MNEWVMIIWIMILPIFIGSAYGAVMYWAFRVILFLEKHNPITLIWTKWKERSTKKAHRCPTCGTLDTWTY